MNQLLRRFRSFVFLTAVLTLAAPAAWAQGCSLCTSQTNGGDSQQLTKYRGQTLNTGILYLAAVPYLAASALGIVWYRNRRRRLATKRA